MCGAVSHVQRWTVPSPDGPSPLPSACALSCHSAPCVKGCERRCRERGSVSRGAAGGGVGGHGRRYSASLKLWGVAAVCVCVRERESVSEDVGCRKRGGSDRLYHLKDCIT
jgi:hypothetical protein